MGTQMLRLRLFGRFFLAHDEGAEIQLRSKKGRALLAYLALPLGRARSREEIIALLWSDRSETQGRASLRQELARLKRDLGEEAIKAIRITGETVSLDPAMIRLEEGRSGEQLLSGFHLKDEAFEEWLRDERLRLENHGDLPRVFAGTLQTEKPAICVLPFKNISGEPAQERFAQGITEDIIIELSRFDYLSQSYAVQSMREKLGVDFIVEGSVRKAGDRIRVTAQLADMKTGKHLWAERYDRLLDDTFDIQVELAREIASVVPRKLDRLATQQARRKHLDELTAYDHFLRAKWFLNCDFSSSVGLAHLYEAIRIDPEFAIAHATLADYCAYSHMHTGVLTQDTAMRALRSAEQALKLEPTDPIIHAIVSEVYFGSWLCGNAGRCCGECVVRPVPGVIWFGSGISALAGVLAVVMAFCARKRCFERNVVRFGAEQSSIYLLIPAISGWMPRMFITRVRL